MKTKICTKCKQEKDINEFKQHKAYKDGYTTQCKCCINEHKKEIYKYNKVRNSKKVIDENEMKKCNICGELKPLKDYYKNCGNKDGHTNECKCCMDNKQKSRIKQLTPYEKAKNAEYHRNYRLKKKQQLEKINTIIYI